MIINLFFLALWALWILGSIAALGQLGFFSGQPLAAAPQRTSQFTLLHVAAVAMIYLGLGILGVVIFQRLGLPIYSPPAATTAPSHSVPASGPATTAAATVPATAATASAPATSTAPATDLDEIARAETLDIVLRGFIVAVILLLATRMVAGGIPAFGLGLRQLPKGIIAGITAGFLLVPWMIALQFIVITLSSILRHGPLPVHPILEALGEHPNGYAEVVLILAAVLAAPITEELFFRGLMQTALLSYGRLRTPPAGFPVELDDPEKVPQIYIPPAPPTPVGSVSPAWRWVAILTTSLLFASIHIGNGVESLPIIFLLSIALGYVYERTGNLWASITLHAGFNTISTLLFLLAGM